MWRKQVTLVCFKLQKRRVRVRHTDKTHSLRGDFTLQAVHCITKAEEANPRHSSPFSLNKTEMKRRRSKSLKHIYKRGYFEAGTVKGSAHPRNNIYLRFAKNEEWDFTVDEAAAIVSVLGCAIMDYTHDKRDELSPHK